MPEVQTDKSRRQREAILSVDVPSDSREAFKQAYLPQMSDDLVRYTDWLEEFCPGEGLTPGAFLRHVEYLRLDPEAVSPEACLLWANRAQQAITNGAKNEEASLDAAALSCSDFAFACWKRAFRAGSKATVLAFEAIINALYAGIRGVDDKIAELFEVAFQNYQDPAIFRGYWNFQRERGQTERACDFALESVELFSVKDDGLADVLNHIFKYAEQGDLIRMQMLERDYHENPQVGPALTMHMVACLKYSGDYQEAMVALAKAKKMGFSEKEMDFLARSVSDLIPPFAARPYGGLEKEGEITGASEGKSSSAALFSQRPRWVAAIKSGAYKNCIDMLAIFYKSENISSKDYFWALTEYLHCFVDDKMYRHDPKDGVYDADDYSYASMLSLNEAEVAGRIRIPVELKNVMAAKMMEYAYGKGHHEPMVANYTDSFNGLWDEALRGTAYYFAKTLFATVARRVPEEMKQNAIVSAETLGRIQLGLSIFNQKMPAFAGTEWEEEIWRGCFLPNFAQFEKLISVNYSGNQVEKICRRVIAEGSEYLDQVYLVLLRALQKKDRLLDHLEELKTLVGMDYLKYAAPHVDDLLAKAVEGLMGRARIAETYELITAVSGWKKDRRLTSQICVCLLHPSYVNMERYREAGELAAGFPDLNGELADKFDRARRKLGIVEYEERSLDDQMAAVAGCDKLKELGEMDDPERMEFILSELADDRNLFLAMMEEQMTSGSDVRPLGGILKEVFGFESLEVRVEGQNLVLFLETEPKSGDGLDRVRVEVGIDDLGTGEGLNGKILEAALLEVLADEEASERQGITAEILNPENVKLARFRVKKAIEAAMDGTGISLETVEGLSGLDFIEMRNEVVSERLMAGIVAADFSDPDVLRKAIDHYHFLIGHYRDMDHAVTYYDAGAASESVFGGQLQNVRIFGHEFACRKLAGLGVNAGELRDFGLIDPERSNFVGYYELQFAGEDGKNPKTVSVFLDKSGKAVIPGISENNPLYMYYWLVTLENLALTVVPELGPFVQIFREKGAAGEDGPAGKIRRGLKRIESDPLSESGRMLANLRHACAVLLIDDAGGGGRPASGAKGELHKTIDKLDKLRYFFSIIELVDRNIFEWPLYVQDAGSLSKVDNLFVGREGRSYLNLAVYRKLFGDCGELGGVEMVEGVEAVDFEKIPAAVTDTLMEKVKVKRHPGFAYRLPVRTLSKKPDTGDFVEVRLNGDIYYVVANVISKKMREISARTPGIDIDFNPAPVLYALLYDRSRGKAVAATYVGPAHKDSAGAYIHENVRNNADRHKAGEVITLELAEGEVKAKLAGMERGQLQEVVFEVNVNIGYKQGMFAPLGDYCRREADEQVRTETGNAILDLLLKEAEQIFASGREAALKLREVVERERNLAKMRDPDLQLERISSLEMVPGPVYRIDVEKDKVSHGEFRTLRRKNLKILSADGEFRNIYDEAARKYYYHKKDGEKVLVVYEYRPGDFRIARVTRSVLKEEPEFGWDWRDELVDEDEDRED